MILSAKKELTRGCLWSKDNLPTIFIACGLELLRLKGRLGAITAGTEFFLCRYRKWPVKVVLAMGHSDYMPSWITLL